MGEHATSAAAAFPDSEPIHQRITFFFHISGLWPRMMVFLLIGRFLLACVDSFVPV